MLFRSPFLIGARALQGVGSGIIQALGLAIVTREFKPAERGLALGLWSMAAAASISFGPLLGGYLVDAYSWHKIFDVNVPVGVLAVLLAAFVQKEWKNQTRSPFDWQGFAAIVLFMPLAIYALARGNSPSNPGGWSAPEVIGCFIVAGTCSGLKYDPYGKSVFNQKTACIKTAQNARYSNTVSFYHLTKI